MRDIKRLLVALFRKAQRKGGDVWRYRIELWRYTVALWRYVVALFRRVRLRRQIQRRRIEMGSLAKRLTAILTVFITFALSAMFLGWWFLLLNFGVLIFLALMIFFVLASRNLWFTFVNEGTAKIAVKAGEFAGALIQWEKHTFDADWNVVEEDETHREPWHPFGGLRFYGFYPLWSIHTYQLRWHDLQRAEAEVEKPVFHEEVLDYVLLRPDVYWTKLIRAETAGRELERIPLDVEFLTTMKVLNPYKAMFRAPIGWVENVLLRLAPVYRGLIANKTLDELLVIRGKGDEIWAELAGAREFNLLRKVFEEEWGIKIEENGIQIKDIDLPKEYQEAATLKWRAQRERERFIEKYVVAELESEAKSKGKSLEEIQAEKTADPIRQQEFIQDVIKRAMAIEGQSFVDIRVDGAEGIEASLLNLLAAWKRMPTGGGPSESPSGSPSGSAAGTVPGKKQTRAETAEIFRQVKKKEEKEKGKQ